jgi:hypothetical protein
MSERVWFIHFTVASSISAMIIGGMPVSAVAQTSASFASMILARGPVFGSGLYVVFSEVLYFIHFLHTLRPVSLGHVSGCVRIL